MINDTNSLIQKATSCGISVSMASDAQTHSIVSWVDLQAFAWLVAEDCARICMVNGEPTELYTAIRAKYSLDNPADRR